jgi:hypothetical protein
MRRPLFATVIGLPIVRHARHTSRRILVINSLRRRARIVLAMFGVLASSSLVVAAPAFADSSLTWYKFYPDRYAHASFTSYGEIFKVSDDEADGASVRVFWSYRNSSIVQGFCTNSNGSGTTKTCDFSIAEGRAINWCLERYDFSTETEYTFKCKDDVA